jgi:hypothetical protein
MLIIARLAISASTSSSVTQHLDRFICWRKILRNLVVGLNGLRRKGSREQDLVVSGEGVF